MGFSVAAMLQWLVHGHGNGLLGEVQCKLPSSCTRCHGISWLLRAAAVLRWMQHMMDDMMMCSRVGSG